MSKIIKRKDKELLLLTCEVREADFILKVLELSAFDSKILYQFRFRDKDFKAPKQVFENITLQEPLIQSFSTFFIPSLVERTMLLY